MEVETQVGGKQERVWSLCEGCAGPDRTIFEDDSKGLACSWRACSWGPPFLFSVGASRPPLAPCPSAHRRGAGLTDNLSPPSPGAGPSSMIIWMLSQQEF